MENKTEKKIENHKAHRQALKREKKEGLRYQRQLKEQRQRKGGSV